MTIDVYFFAGAAHAFGTTQARVELEGQPTLESLLTELRGGAVETADPDAARVLSRCSFLLNKRAVREPSTPLAPAADGTIRVDVLPPFAGG